MHLRMKGLLVAGAILAGAVFAAPLPSEAGIAISVNFGPPALPVYVQPEIPAPGYLWTPGYWAYAPAGYYWVPGAWVQPPEVGYLWTPPYWGYGSGFYAFHPGYWGRTVGFYGGINYGFGYGGSGFGGGYWNGNNFLYNRSVTNVNVNVIHNTYVRDVTVINDNHISYNGGPSGIQASPNADEIAAQHSEHLGATSFQHDQIQSARQNHAQFASENGGHPSDLASNRSGFAYGNEVNTRQGNQQSRISSGTRDGQITPGEERNLENRDESIHNEAQTERAANGGSLTGAERAQINERQNNVSGSIYADKHNYNNDETAGLRHGRTAGQEKFRAQKVHQKLKPRGPHAHHE